MVKYAVLDNEGADKWLGHEEVSMRRLTQPGSTWDVYRAVTAQLTNPNSGFIKSQIGFAPLRSVQQHANLLQAVLAVSFWHQAWEEQLVRIHLGNFC